MMASPNSQPHLPEMSGALPGSRGTSNTNDVWNFETTSNYINPISVSDPRHVVDDGGIWRSNDERASLSVESRRGQARNKEEVVFKSKKARPLRRVFTSGVGKPRKKQTVLGRRSSLEDILRLTINGPILERPETRIPLPDSRSSSISFQSERWGKKISRSSLEAIEDVGAPVQVPPELPLVIPLPPSPAGSAQFDHVINPPIPISIPLPLPFRVLPVYDYDTILDRASNAFSHLKKTRIRELSRNSVPASNIRIVDFRPQLPPVSLQYHIRDGLEISTLYDYEYLQVMQPDIRLRLLVVEDLSSETMHHLGRQYGVSPEFFEEHLLNSGYLGADYNDLPASTWKTSGMKKSHISVKWHRPVLRIPEVPLGKQDFRDLLNPEDGRLEYTLKGSNDVRVFTTTTNIFRTEWELWTDPTIDLRTLRACGWEERASVWVRTLPGGGKIVILVLDPLPILGAGVEKSVEETLAVFNIPSSSDGSAEENTPRPLEDVEAMDQDVGAIKERRPNQKPATRLQRMIRGLARPPKRKVNTTKTPKEGIKMMRKKIIEDQVPVPIFDQMAPRSLIDIGFEEALQDDKKLTLLEEQLVQTRSTSVEYCQRILQDQRRQRSTSTPKFSSLISPLFYIIRSDALSLLKLLHTCLDEINTAILEDSKMEEGLSRWRELLTRSQFELPDFMNSLESLLSFAQVIDGSPINSLGLDDNVDSMAEDGVTGDFDKLKEQIGIMLARLETASSSLTQNMALLDSRRSIAEAEGIAKLTELAFFFIPLTFAATLFGMEIEQLKDPAPLSLFIATGLAFVTGSYLIRLMIRSVWVRDLKHAANVSIKIYADRRHLTVQRGNVPASLFLSWVYYELMHVLMYGWRHIHLGLPKLTAMIWRTMGFVISTLLILALIAAAPIAVLWTRPINHGTKVMITVLVLLIVVPMVVITHWTNTSANIRRETVRPWKDLWRNIRSGRSRVAIFLMVLGGLTLVIVPLAIIWTRPIAQGIRVGVTFSILFIALGTAVSLGMPWILSTVGMRVVLRI